jgi:hypothetical protein
VLEEHTQEQEIISEENMNHILSLLPLFYEINHIPHAPGERKPIQSYVVNDQDAYIFLKLHSNLRPMISKKENIGLGDRNFQPDMV